MVNKKSKTIQSSPPKPPRDYSLIKAIREEKLYKNNIRVRDIKVRKWVDENIQAMSKGSIMPGQLIMFNFILIELFPYFFLGKFV